MDAERGSREPAGAITIEQESSGRRVLHLTGNVDTEVATRFRSAQGREKVAVDAIDAGTVTFISSSGLGLLVRYAEASVAAGGRRPVLRSVSRQVERVLQVAGLDSFFPRTGPGAGAQPDGGEPPATEPGT
jgi:anti-anti-sigma factor